MVRNFIFLKGRGGGGNRQGVFRLEIDPDSGPENRGRAGKDLCVESFVRFFAAPLLEGGMQNRDRQAQKQQKSDHSHP